MRLHGSPAPLAAALALLLGVAGCAATRPTHFFVLDPVEPASAKAGTGPILGLGPVEMPAYLDRAEIVTREGEHGVRLGDLDRWAEPLEGMVGKRLAERLRAGTGARDVVAVPSRGGGDPPTAVGVKVDRLDADGTGKVVLEAGWRLYRTADGKAVKAGHELITTNGPPPPDYAGIVATMAKAVDELGRRVAAAVASGRPKA